MAKQKFGLGRGLDALISGASEVMAAQQPSRVDEQSILLVAIESIMPNPRQPRRIFREDDPKLLELSASIKEHGLLQPLVVTRLDAVTMADDAAKKVQEPWADSWFSSGSADSQA
ncbi:MAG TPA: ParB N-terminal domain-containing protein, partial [Ktedonobacteraceae bacterium]